MGAYIRVLDTVSTRVMRVCHGHVKIHHVFFSIYALNKLFWGIFRIVHLKAKVGCRCFVWRLWCYFCCFCRASFGVLTLYVITRHCDLFSPCFVSFCVFVLQITDANFLFLCFCQNCCCRVLFVCVGFALLLARACFCLCRMDIFPG